MISTSGVLTCCVVTGTNGGEGILNEREFTVLVAGLALYESTALACKYCICGDDCRDAERDS